MGKLKLLFLIPLFTGITLASQSFNTEAGKTQLAESQQLLVQGPAASDVVLHDGEIICSEVIEYCTNYSKDVDQPGEDAFLLGLHDYLMSNVLKLQSDEWLNQMYENLRIKILKLRKSIAQFRGFQKIIKDIKLAKQRESKLLERQRQLCIKEAFHKPPDITDYFGILGCKLAKEAHNLPHCKLHISY